MEPVECDLQWRKVSFEELNCTVLYPDRGTPDSNYPDFGAYFKGYGPTETFQVEGFPYSHGGVVALSGHLRCDLQLWDAVKGVRGSYRVYAVHGNSPDNNTPDDEVRARRLARAQGR